MSLNLKEDQKVVILDYVTKAVVSRGKVMDICAYPKYPIAIKLDEGFIQSASGDEMKFTKGEHITFNDESLFRGKNHEDHKLWDLEVLSEEYYNRVYLERTSSTYKHLMDFFSKEAVKISKDVDKALELLIPHIKSGKLTVEIVKILIEENL